jgi:predicted transposase/invertase (TIGR01784 family)
MEGNERYINPYTDFQKEYWDYTSTLQTAEKKGRAEGRAEEKRDTARKLKAMGVLSDEQIAAATGLTIDEIKSL